LNYQLVNFNELFGLKEYHGWGQIDIVYQIQHKLMKLMGFLGEEKIDFSLFIWGEVSHILFRKFVKFLQTPCLIRGLAMGLFPFFASHQEF
jgi:hypothetical protein